MPHCSCRLVPSYCKIRLYLPLDRYSIGIHRSLTDDGQVVPETLGGGISEIHTTSIHALIVPLHFIHQ